jgi:hypothetical protein
LIESSGSEITGRSSYSTLISFSAASAISSDSAATAAISSRSLRTRPTFSGK